MSAFIRRPNSFSHSICNFPSIFTDFMRYANLFAFEMKVIILMTFLTIDEQKKNPFNGIANKIVVELLPRIIWSIDICRMHVSQTVLKWNLCRTQFAIFFSCSWVVYFPFDINEIRQKYCGTSIKFIKYLAAFKNAVIVFTTKQINRRIPSHFRLINKKHTF